MSEHNPENEIEYLKGDSFLFKDTQKWISIWAGLTSEFLVLHRETKVHFTFFKNISKSLSLFREDCY